MRWLARMISALAGIGALIRAGFWNTRRNLPYNEEGRYFDPVTGVSLAEHGVTAYGALALALAAVAGLALYAASKL